MGDTSPSRARAFAERGLIRRPAAPHPAAGGASSGGRHAPAASYSLSPLSPTELDTRLLMLARTRGHTPARERTVATFSRTGEHAACWLVLGLARAAGETARPERRTAWLRGTMLVAVSYALNTGVKFLVRRPRPELTGLEPLTPTVTALSFPSAHATTSFAAARVYGTLAPAAPLYAIAVLMALSRIYLGVHYPSDIVVGALLGTALAAVAEATGGISWP